jgi:hypothetical protein
MKPLSKNPLDTEFFAIIETLKMSATSNLHASLPPRDAAILVNGIHRLVHVYQAANNEKFSHRVESFFADIGEEWLDMLAGKPKKRRR